MAILGALLVFLVLWDTFETIVIPKLIERRFRLSTVYARSVWRAWHWLIDRLPEGGVKSAALMSFGAFSIIFLFIVWAAALVFSFALVHAGISDLGPLVGFWDYIYFSGVTFFTLGYGDAVPVTDLGRFVAVFEVGTGFGFLALVISYIPVLYHAFSRREHFIMKMDSRFGSVPSAGEALRRYGGGSATRALRDHLKDAEQWSAEQLEAYLSYPILAYYRSQHETQSWLAAITAELDLCALVLAGSDPVDVWEFELAFQANATFAMARHVVVDLSYVLDDPPAEDPPSRLTPDELLRIKACVETAFGSVPKDFESRLDSCQRMYEPFLIGLARDLHLVLPAWTAGGDAEDNWQRTAWDGDAHF